MIFFLHLFLSIWRDRFFALTINRRQSRSSVWLLDLPHLQRLHFRFFFDYHFIALFECSSQIIWVLSLNCPRHASFASFFLVLSLKISLNQILLLRKFFVLFFVRSFRNKTLLLWINFILLWLVWKRWVNMVFLIKKILMIFLLSHMTCNKTFVIHLVQHPPPFYIDFEYFVSKPKL